jgi:hypothetical protein
LKEFPKTLRYCQKFYENQGITHENDKREQSRGEEEVG